jgi:hypothetical protein
VSFAHGYVSQIVWQLFIGFFRALVEISLKGHSMRLLKAADSGDGATHIIYILFGLDLAMSGILAVLGLELIVLIIHEYFAPVKKEEDKEPKNLKKQTPDKEKQCGA